MVGGPTTPPLRLASSNEIKHKTEETEIMVEVEDKNKENTSATSKGESLLSLLRVFPGSTLGKIDGDDFKPSVKSTEMWNRLAETHKPAHSSSSTSATTEDSETMEAETEQQELFE